jgi:hypothetical protein
VKRGFVRDRQRGGSLRLGIVSLAGSQEQITKVSPRLHV